MGYDITTDYLMIDKLKERWRQFMTGRKQEQDVQLVPREFCELHNPSNSG